MPRPYFRSSGEDLRLLFDANPNDIALLRSVIEELQFRKTPKMQRLREEVQQRLQLLDSDNTSSTLLHSSVDSLAPSKQKLLFPEEHSQPSKEPSLFPEIVSDPAKSKQQSASAHFSRVEHVSIRDTIAEIRPPGNLQGVPLRREFSASRRIELDVPENASVIAIYIAALSALVRDMKRTGSGLRTLILSDGVKVELDGHETGYQFSFEGDETLFEGASVLLAFSSKQVEGKIVSVASNRLIVSISEDLGPEIHTCTLRIDNTAMLEALRKRLEEISSGTVTAFNSVLAEAVLANSGDEMPQGEYENNDQLNLLQNEAVAKSLSNSVYYVWGPPGTGKTKLLSELIRRLFDLGKKTLICSNTNRAVDQVLLKLCETLKSKGHPAFEDGKIIRVGQIALPELEAKYKDYVTLDGIVERRSSDLRARRQSLENEIATIRSETERVRSLIATFKRLDEVEQSLAKLHSDAQRIEIDKSSATANSEKLKQRSNQLHADLQKHLNASRLRQIFMRSSEEIQNELTQVLSAIAVAESEVTKLESALQWFPESISEATKRVLHLKHQVVGVDRAKLEQELSIAEGKSRPLIAEIAEINRRLNDLAKAVLNEARIIGATVTKLYLSPQQFSGFDTVIVDEASMVLLPALYHAAGCAKEKVIVSGDFRQLPPIVTTNEEAILEIIGTDVFEKCKISAGFTSKSRPKRTIALEEQYRMVEPICNLVSNSMYDGRLRTSTRHEDDCRPCEPFDAHITIVETSTIAPFVNRHRDKSRYNLMHSLAIRNLIHRLTSTGFPVNRIGVCTPYAAQSKLLQKLLRPLSVDAGTIHKYQGDEKDLMIIDLPDSHGEYSVGWWLEADQPDDDGARLFNVAVTRAKSHLVFFANLDYLDRKLPSRAMIRSILFESQSHGNIVDVRDVLRFYPIIEELRRCGSPIDLNAETLGSGLFHQRDFDRVCLHDLACAKKSVLIFSGFFTPQRIATYESVFRERISDGVSIRCVTRPPHNNAIVQSDEARSILDALEKLGCVVDTRLNTHQKVVIVDGRVAWFGSLNPLSHSGATGEVMARVENEQFCSQLASFLAINRSNDTFDFGISATKRENPQCGQCKSRTFFSIGRYGPYWQCESLDCKWRQNCRQFAKKPEIKLDGIAPPACPECGATMIARSSFHGAFFGCSRYPKCKGTVNPGKINQPRKNSRSKPARKRI